jgi:hypothetical protein
VRNKKTTCPIANRQTVLESAHPEEGPIFLKLFFFFLNTFCIPVIISRHFLNLSTGVHIFNPFDYWDVANL